MKKALNELEKQTEVLGNVLKNKGGGDLHVKEASPPGYKEWEDGIL